MLLRTSKTRSRFILVTNNLIFVVPHSAKKIHNTNGFINRFMETKIYKKKNEIDEDKI